jgi:hypothetical protein
MKGPALGGTFSNRVAISFPGWPEWLGIKKKYFCAVCSGCWEDLVDADGVEAASADLESEEIS